MLQHLQTFQVYVQRQSILRMKPNQTVVIVSRIKNFIFLIEEANASGSMTWHVDHFNFAIAQVKYSSVFDWNERRIVQAVSNLEPERIWNPTSSHHFHSVSSHFRRTKKPQHIKIIGMGVHFCKLVVAAGMIGVGMGVDNDNGKG